jgi:hypothetical protein
MSFAGSAPATASTRPRFRESWQGIRGASFRLSDMGKLPSFSLDWFEFDWMLRAALNE